MKSIASQTENPAEVSTELLNSFIYIICVYK